MLGYKWASTVCEILNFLLPSFAGSISQSSEKHVCSRHGSGFAALLQRYRRREHGHHETRQAVISILEMRSSRRTLHSLIASRIEQLRTHHRTKTERQICDAWRTRTCVARGRKQTQGMRDRITQVNNFVMLTPICELGYDDGFHCYHPL